MRSISSINVICKTGTPPTNPAKTWKQMLLRLLESPAQMGFHNSGHFGLHQVQRLPQKTRNSHHQNKVRVFRYMKWWNAPHFLAFEQWNRQSILRTQNQNFRKVRRERSWLQEGTVHSRQIRQQKVGSGWQNSCGEDFEWRGFKSPSKTSGTKAELNPSRTWIEAALR